MISVRFSIVRLVPLCLVAAIALASLAGKTFDVPLLRAWLPGSVPMKEVTATLMLANAAVGFLSIRPDRRNFAFPIYLLALVTFGIAAGLVREIAHLENVGSFDPRASFFPSILTVVSMTLLACKALAGLIWRSPLPADYLSVPVALIGASGLIGYAFHIPALYYFNPGYTTAMAVNTALCFLLLGCVPIPHAEG